MMQKPTTMEKQKALSMFKTYYRGFKSNYGMNVIELDYNAGDFAICHGIEKTCLVFKDFPWVIKCDTYRNDETQPCKTEAKNYQRAVSYELGDYFAPTYYIGNYDGVDLILQKKLVVDSCYTKSHAYEITGEEIFSPYTIEYGDREEKIYPSWNSGDSLDQEDILAGLYDNYRLIAFCNKYRINDLHDGNFGWDGDKPYITDFSGYHDCDTTYSEGSSYEY